MRIGSLDDPDYLFGLVGPVVPGPDGFMYSLHPREAVVRRWTGDGAPAGTVGRRGEGPGEFTQPGQMGFFGDSLWVMDYGLYRLSYFDPDGLLLGTSSPEITAVSPGGAPFRVSAPLRDGTFMARGNAPSYQWATGGLTEVPLVRTDDSGNVLGTIWTQFTEQRDVFAILRDDGFGGTFSTQPFGDSPVWFLAERGVIVADRRAWTGVGPAVVKVTTVALAGDTLFTSDIPYVPTPLPAERVDSAVRVMTERLRNFPEGRIRDAMYRPSHVPPIGSVMVGNDGTIWLRRFDPIVSESGESMTEWWVLDPDGTPLARAVTPSGLRVRAISEDMVWGVEQDEMEVEYIVRYGLVKGD